MTKPMGTGRGWLWDMAVTKAKKSQNSMHKVNPGVWELRLYAGRRRDSREPLVSKRFAARQGEAVRGAAALLVELEQNEGGGETRGTFGELAERWYAHGRPGWKARTADSYRRHLDQVILPALGGKDADRLRPAELDRLWASLADGRGDGETRSGPATVERYAAAVKAIFNFGIRRGELARNLVVQAPPPRSHAREITPPTVEEGDQAAGGRSCRPTLSSGPCAGWRSPPGPARASCAPSGGPTSTWMGPRSESPARFPRSAPRSPRSRPRTTRRGSWLSTR